MRFSDFLVAVNLTALAHGSCGTSAAAGWGSKAAAGNGRGRRSERRVFSKHGQHTHSSSTVAFLGHRPSTATKNFGGSEPEATVVALPKPAAAEAGGIGESTDAAASSDETGPASSEPRYEYGGCLVPSLPVLLVHTAETLAADVVCYPACV